MRKIHSNERGFTLVEILIVLALLGIMAAVVIPNVSGFLGRGKSESYRTDARSIQAATDAYYTDTTINCGGIRCFPTGDDGSVGVDGLGRSGDMPFAGSGYYINLTNLVTRNLLREVPQSAASQHYGGSSGSYIWYVKANGVVDTILASDLTSTGYQTNTYP